MCDFAPKLDIEDGRCGLAGGNCPFSPSFRTE